MKLIVNIIHHKGHTFRRVDKEFGELDGLGCEVNSPEPKLPGCLQSLDKNGTRTCNVLAICNR